MNAENLGEDLYRAWMRNGNGGLARRARELLEAPLFVEIEQLRTKLTRQTGEIERALAQIMGTALMYVEKLLTDAIGRAEELRLLNADIVMAERGVVRTLLDATLVTAKRDVTSKEMVDDLDRQIFDLLMLLTLKRDLGKTPATPTEKPDETLIAEGAAGMIAAERARIVNQLEEVFASYRADGLMGPFYDRGFLAGILCAKKLVYDQGAKRGQVGG